MPTRSQIKRSLQKLGIPQLKRAQREASDACKELAPQLAELEETAQDTPELDEVRALFEEVCTRAQEADIELSRRTSGAGAPQKAPAPEEPAPTPPKSGLASMWPPPWWVYTGVAAPVLLYLGLSKRQAKRRAAVQAWLTRQGRKVRG